MILVLSRDPLVLIKALIIALNSALVFILFSSTLTDILYRQRVAIYESRLGGQRLILSID